ncbi:MAG: hypothetical protein Kow0063_15840 [Anaerolineae bacterium]
MDYRKVDAALAAALDEVQDPEEPTLSVFIHTAYAPQDAEVAFLKDLGVRGVTGTRQVFTATLSPRAVAELSEQPWLRYMKLSRRLRLMEDA